MRWLHKTLLLVAAAVGIALMPSIASANTIIRSGNSPSDTIAAGQSVESSPNSGTFLSMQNTDGNLVLYARSGIGAAAKDIALWATNTNQPGSRAVMQTDGNFVVYNSANVALWQSHTYGNPGAYLDIQDDGNLVVYNSANQPIWRTGTHVPPPPVYTQLRNRQSVRWHAAAP